MWLEYSLPFVHIFDQLLDDGPFGIDNDSLENLSSLVLFSGLHDLHELLVGMFILDPGLFSFIKDSLADIDRRLVRIQASERFNSKLSDHSVMASCSVESRLMFRAIEERSKFDTGLEDVASQSYNAN